MGNGSRNEAVNPQHPQKDGGRVHQDERRSRSGREARLEETFGRFGMSHMDQRRIL